MNGSRIVLFLLAASMVVLGFSCLEETPEELTGVIPDIPPPFGLEALVSNGAVKLSWRYDDRFEYSEFRVYRSDDGQATWSTVGRVQSAGFEDSALRNGYTYWYRVSGVDVNGIEGDPSASFPAKADVFSLSINNGAEFTGSRDVTIDFAAPAETRFVMLFEAGTSVDSLWLPYEARKQFRLSGGEGLKVVAARFQDDLGNLTETVADSILLDMHADIAALSFGPAGLVPPGTELHFEVEAGGRESGGVVEITIPGREEPLLARDDGAMGDSTAGDGIYGRDYELPLTFRRRAVVPSAVFVDAAGNRSEEKEFGDEFGITDPPAPVYLFPPVDSTASTITIRWSESGEEYFARYDVYRDVTSDVTPDRSARVAVVFDRLTLSHTDTGLEEGGEYFYRVYVVNDLGESAGSLVRAAGTADPPPDPVVCDPPSSVGTDRLTLTWSRSEAGDFKEYRVYRSTSPGVTEADGVLVGAPIQDRYTTFVDDSGLDLINTTYYYRVYVYDLADQSARSNEVSTQ